MLYIYAFADRPVDAWTEGDRSVESVPVESIFVICERRPASPAVSEAELRRQHSIVVRISESAPAVLPARFGSLMDQEELARIVRDRSEDFLNALDLVRGNVQMTVRIVGETPSAKAVAPPESGRAYLEQRLKEKSPPVPPRTVPVFDSISTFVVAERRTTGDGGMVTVYQLIGRADVQKYMRAFMRARVAGMQLTGPWPPFAFVPDL